MYIKQYLCQIDVLEEELRCSLLLKQGTVKISDTKLLILMVNLCDRSWPKAVPSERPFVANTGQPVSRWPLDFGLLRDFKCIIDFDAEIPDCAFELSMAEKQLHSTKIFGSTVDQGCLSSPHGMGAIRCGV